MKQLVQITVALMVSAGLLWITCHQINFHQLAEIYTNARIEFLPLIVLTVVVELVFRAIKWQLLLSPAGRVKVWDTFRLETAALALNNVLPLRLGEIVRGVYGAQFFGLPLATVLGSIAAEKVLDVAVLLTLAAMAAGLGVLPGMNLSRILICIIVGLVIAVSLTLLIRSGRLKVYPRFALVVDRVTLGFTSLGKRKTAAGLFLLALVQWLSNALGYYFASQSLGLGTDISVARSLAMAVTGATASSMPGMPGYFGSVEFVITGLMKTWGIPAEMSFACALGAHAMSYLVITLFGIILLCDLGRSPLQVWRNFKHGIYKSETVNAEPPHN